MLTGVEESVSGKEFCWTSANVIIVVLEQATITCVMDRRTVRQTIVLCIFVTLLRSFCFDRTDDAFINTSELFHDLDRRLVTNEKTLHSSNSRNGILKHLTSSHTSQKLARHFAAPYAFAATKWRLIKNFPFPYYKLQQTHTRPNFLVHHIHLNNVILAVKQNSCRNQSCAKYK